MFISLLPFLELVDQASGGNIMGGNLGVVLQLSQDNLCQLLTQLDTPLVEGVDAPDSTFNEGNHLVVCDQSTQSCRGDLLAQNGGCWSVTRESLVRNQGFIGSLGTNLLRSLSKHQGLGLGEEVGSQHLLVLVVLDRVVGLGSNDEVCRNQLGTLVDQLEEGVLSVGGWLTEENNTSLVVDELVVLGDRLTVGFHGKLLQVSWESVHVLVKRCHKLGLGLVEIVVPDGEQTSEEWNVLLEWSVLEVLVNGLGTFQKLLEVVVADV